MRTQTVVGAQAAKFDVKADCVVIYRMLFIVIPTVQLPPVTDANCMLYGKAEETAKRLGIKKLFVSISNTAVYASAYAVGEGDLG